MQTLTRALGGALVLATALIAMPAQLVAQECTAEVSPAQIEAGANAARLTVTVSAPIGAVTNLEAAGGSGIAVAAPSDIPRVELAAGEERAPITMAEAENQWNVWVNTMASQPGTHRLTFVGTEGSCTANVTVLAPN